MVTTVFIGGEILVSAGVGACPERATAIAFESGLVLAHNSEAESLADAPGTVVIDLGGGVLAPSLGDGHAHPLYGGIEQLGPNIREAGCVQDILDRIASWKQDNPTAQWIVGASYDPTLAEGGRFDARWLDAVTGETPTVLRAMDYHSVWVNTAALQMAQITSDTDDPPLGRILRREDGSPLGTLLESAANNFLADVAPNFELQNRIHALEESTRKFAAQGTTWVQDAWVEPDDLEVYLAAARQRRLHTRVNLAFRADPARWKEQVSEFKDGQRMVTDAASDRLTGNTVKFFVDGVIEGGTAALIEPYSDCPTDRGIPNWSRESLIKAAEAFDAAGFQLHLHAIGDAANRNALDALEHVSGTKSRSPLPHVVAHVQLLTPEDIDRFASLGVVANFEPFWAKCDALMRDLTLPRLGHPRSEWLYLIGSVHRTGAVISFGSDWPVTTLDWRPAMATAMTRSDHMISDEPLLPEERIDASVAFAAYTSGIAYQAGLLSAGSLHVGNTADAVWLSKDPLKTPPSEIPSIEVNGTWLAGDRVW